MKALSVLRGLTPLGLGVVVAGLILAVVLLGHGLGLRWDPFDLAGRRLRRAEAHAVVAASDAAARRLEAEGMAEQARRLDQLHQQTVAVERATARAAAQARSAHDASTPLDPARADRLLDHDRELCRLAPAVCRPAAPGAPPGGGSVVRSGPPA